MSLKSRIVTGFLLYWVYQLYRVRRKLVPPVDKFRFPDFE
jgi:hypothetical protein